MDKWDKRFMELTEHISGWSSCIRGNRHVGAIVVRDKRVIATGYNGAPRGEPNCCDVGECYREAHGIPHGEQYEKCVAVHAECNAIISASRKEMLGATLYLAGFEGGKPLEDPQPCLICNRLIKNAGIARVINARGEVRL